jgi:hypothetical protein
VADLHFFRVYQVATSTGWHVPATKVLSINYTTVELSTAFLVVVLLFVIFIIVASIRYIIFYNRNKAILEELFVPDGAIDWMLHAAKSAHSSIDEGLSTPAKNIKDRIHFQTATLGSHPSNTPACRLARVQSGVGLSDLKPPKKSKAGQARVTQGTTVTVKEIRDSSSAPSSSAASDKKGNSVVKFMEPNYDARQSTEAVQGNGTRNSAGPLDHMGEKSGEPL